MSDLNKAPSPTSESSGTDDQDATSEADAPPSPSFHPSGFSEAEYQIASLAATLVAGAFRDSFSSQGEDMSHPRHDELYFSALKRAHWMLEKSSDPHEVIEAYRVFEEGKVYSAQGIADRFELVGWKGLSRNSVKPLLADIRSAMEKLPKSLGVSSDKKLNRTHKAAVEKIRKSFLELEKDETVRASFRGFGLKSLKFVRCLDRRPIGRHGIASMIDNDRHGPFLRWCFFEDSKGPKYRPHEIFRFAEMLGVSTEELRETRSNLSPRFHPYPRRDTEFFSFGYFEESLMDKASSD
jgi:hypothetical protein